MPSAEGTCNFTLMWQTSLACQDEQQQTSDKNKGSKCPILNVPLYDQSLDLNALASDVSFYHVEKTGENHQFEILARLSLSNPSMKN